MAEIRHLGSWRQHAKRQYSKKISSLELCCILTTYRKLCNLDFQRTHCWISKIQDGWDPPSWKIDMTSFFSAEGGPISIKFRRLVQNDMLTAVMWSKSKPDVELQYGGHLDEFNGMSSQTTYHSAGCCHLVNSLSRFQSNMPHCRV